MSARGCLLTCDGHLHTGWVVPDDCYPCRQLPPVPGGNFSTCQSPGYLNQVGVIVRGAAGSGVGWCECTACTALVTARLPQATVCQWPYVSPGLGLGLCSSLLKSKMQITNVPNCPIPLWLWMGTVSFDAVGACVRRYAPHSVTSHNPRENNLHRSCVHQPVNYPVALRSARHRSGGLRTQQMSSASRPQWVSM